jgi:S-DNA-T family DNA segregation ATPase FtsK/SpoIIIE
MDWRDSNIILGEQMNTRGHDASKLLPSHKGVGILRPDGESDSGDDAIARMVRSDYMPNAEWQAICQRGRALREAAGTLDGHAAGEDTTARAIDAAAVLRALGSAPLSTDDADRSDPVGGLPEPLALVVAHLGEKLIRRPFIPTAELVAALGVEPTAFGRDMGDLGCAPRPGRVAGADGSIRQVRGYATADLRAAVERYQGAG